MKISPENTMYYLRHFLSCYMAENWICLFRAPLYSTYKVSLESVEKFLKNSLLNMGKTIAQRLTWHNPLKISPKSTIVHLKYFWSHYKSENWICLTRAHLYSIYKVSLKSVNWVLDTALLKMVKSFIFRLFSHFQLAIVKKKTY